MIKRSMCQHLIIAVIASGLIACAGPEPMLRSNAKFQLQGQETAKLEVTACQQKAEAAGLKPGTDSRSGNVATGAVLGLISGAAVGASSGLIGGVPGVTIGAAVGAALGSSSVQWEVPIQAARSGSSIRRCGGAVFD